MTVNVNWGNGRSRLAGFVAGDSKAQTGQLQQAAARAQLVGGGAPRNRYERRLFAAARRKGKRKRGS